MNVLHAAASCANESPKLSSIQRCGRSVRGGRGWTEQVPYNAVQFKRLWRRALGGRRIADGPARRSRSTVCLPRPVQLFGAAPSTYSPVRACKRRQVLPRGKEQHRPAAAAAAALLSREHAVVQRCATIVDCRSYSIGEAAQAESPYRNFLPIHQVWPPQSSHACGREQGLQALAATFVGAQCGAGHGG
eukprot:SAG31_NODE_17306_length_676_cov_0.805893_2_plen_188_part_01